MRAPHGDMEETVWSSVVVFYCSLENYHKLSSLKKHKIIIPQFCQSQAFGWFPFSISHGSKSRWWQGYIPCERCQGKVCFQLIQVVGRILFHEAIRMRLPCPCWLLAGGRFQLSLTSFGSWPPSSIFKANDSWVESLSCFESLTHLLSPVSPTYFFWLQQGKVLHFSELLWLDWAQLSNPR